MRGIVHKSEEAMGLELEDSDDKTRRNLVFVSGTLISTWIAGVPIPIVIEKLIGQGIALTPWRVFLAMLLVLTYLILRFRFASETQAAYRELKKEWRNECCEQVSSSIELWLKQYTRTGKESSFFRGSLIEAEREATKNIAETSKTFSGETPKLGRPRIKGYVPFVNNFGEPESDPFSSRVHTQYEWIYQSQQLSSTGNYSPEFKIKGPYRDWLRAKALLKLVTYTKSSLQILVPSILAVVAFCGLIVQLYSSL